MARRPTEGRSAQTEEEKRETKSITNQTAPSIPLPRCAVPSPLRQEGSQDEGLRTMTLAARDFLLPPAHARPAVENANLRGAAAISFPFDRQLGENPA